MQPETESALEQASSPARPNPSWGSAARMSRSECTIIRETPQRRANVSMGTWPTDMRSRMIRLRRSSRSECQPLHRSISDPYGRPVNDPVLFHQSGCCRETCRAEQPPAEGPSDGQWPGIAEPMRDQRASLAGVEIDVSRPGIAAGFVQSLRDSCRISGASSVVSADKETPSSRTPLSMGNSKDRRSKLSCSSTDRVST